MTPGFWFEDEGMLIAAGTILVVLAVAYALDFTRRRHLLEKIGHAPQLAKMAASVSPGRRRMKAFLIVLGIALVALAAARPQTEGDRIWKHRGIDIVLVMDFSKSMLARDVYPSRVERSRLEADRILERFAGDRIGLVVFGGEAIRYPLTGDTTAVRTLYNGLEPADMVSGSDIGEAVRTARCLLLPDRIDSDCGHVRSGGDDPLDPPRATVGGDADLGQRGRAIVIFSDGEDTEGSARAQVERAAQLGIDVYTIGVGTSAGARIPVTDRDGNLSWKPGLDGKTPHVTRLDENALKELARAGGGEDHYFHADPRRISLEGLVTALGKLKEGNIEERTASIPSEAYPFLLFPAFLALLIEACLSDRRRERGKERVRG